MGSMQYLYKNDILVGCLVHPCDKRQRHTYVISLLEKLVSYQDSTHLWKFFPRSKQGICSVQRKTYHDFIVEKWSKNFFFIIKIGFQIISGDNKNLEASLIIIIKSETCRFNSLYRFFFDSSSKSSISCNKSVIPGKADAPYVLNLL